MKFIKVPHRRFAYGNGALGSLFSKMSLFLKPVLKGAAKAAAPVAKRTLKQLGRTGLDVVSNSLADVAEGKNVKEAFKSNIKTGAQRAKKQIKKGVK